MASGTYGATLQTVYSEAALYHLNARAPDQTLYLGTVQKIRLLVLKIKMPYNLACGAEPMVNATARAVSVVAIFGLAQLTLLFYSISHPSIDDWVTISFVISVVFYPMVFAYHGRRIKDWKDRSTQSADLK